MWSGQGAGNGIAVLVSAGIVYEIVAANVSSPQTTELNADKRAPTLMKWVHIGQVQAIMFIAFAAYVDKSHAQAIWTGGIAAMIIMEVAYLHAKQAGLNDGKPGTETW